ncbi:outer membrane beta-barrel protein [Mucilaginibacter aquatilis]|uniref:Outer membrane beta-barrel protein n=1 Tax=Mucilaginibacter aquatilis TaxID=1517760 RepID=A0A6I4IAA1_9SPHI|nr:outer membrane beta-barrel protein [Mucilaginibacter aquatilis]MVN90898.1 outer membrane beta-barrel protein [Mucilaginibacter aquatilis]
MKAFSLLLVSLLFSGITYAQSNYKSGYVITTAKDTLKGYIDFQEWVKSPVSIKYKQQLTDKSYTTYEPSNLRGFKIKGVCEYISFEGNISADEIFYPNLPLNLDTSVVHKAIFLEKLTAGTAINLYYHRDEIRHRFFIEDNSAPIMELIYHEYYNNDKSKVLKDLKYKQQLTLLVGKYLENNAGLIDKIEDVSFDKNSLKTFINAVNAGNGAPSIQPVEKLKVSGFSFFAGVGVNYSKMKVSGPLDLSAAPAGKSYGPLLYAGVNFFPNEKTRKLAFQAELSAWKSKHELTVESKYSDFSPIYKGAIDHWRVRRSNLSIAPGVLYNFYNTNAVKLYAGAGFAINISTSNASHVLIDPKTNNKLFDLNEIPFKKLWVNFPLKAGAVVANKIDFTLKYLPSTDISDYKSSSVSGDTFFLGAAYIF